MRWLRYAAFLRQPLRKVKEESTYADLYLWEAFVAEEENRRYEREELGGPTRLEHYLAQIIKELRVNRGGSVKDPLPFMEFKRPEPSTEDTQAKQPDEPQWVKNQRTHFQILGIKKDARRN